MANNKDFIVKNAVEVGGATKVTVGDAATGGSYTAGYDVANASYDNKSFSVGSQEGDPRGVGFNSDGTTMLVGGGGSSGTNSVFQYTLSTAWDVSTASYTSKAFNAEVNGEGDPTNYYFKSDGTKFYMVGITTDRVYEFDMSTAWDLSTASYTTNQNFNPALGNLQGVSFKADGTKMYLVAQTGYTVYQYSLSTAWDVTTASYDSVSFAAGNYKAHLWFKSDGLIMWMIDLVSDSVVEYNLTTAWDVSTASASGNSFAFASQDTSGNAITVKPDGSKMYIAGNDNNTIYQYSTGSTVTTGSFDLSTGNYFTDTPSADVEYTFSNAGDVQSFQLEVTGNSAGYDLSSAAYDSVSFSVSGQETLPNAIRFKPDGTKMYVIGEAGDDVNEYALSTAWDVSTASYTTVFSVASQAVTPEGFDFSSDGTKMYVANNDPFGSSEAIYQYSLSTAWDVSTASYSSVSYSNTSLASITGLFFKTDGTKFYITEDGSDTVKSYSLSTAWDLSTASYDSVTFSVSSQSSDPKDLAFSSDGTMMVIISSTPDFVFQYSLSTAWDISTASYDSVSVDISSQQTTGEGVAFKSDGTKMYTIGGTGDAVHQYSTSTPITVTWDADIAWPSGTAPDSPAAGEKDIYTFTTDDGGTTYIGVQSGDAFS